MDSKKLTICCVAIILAAIVIGAIIVLTHAEETEIKILSNSSIYEHENITVQLTTANGDPIANQKINMTVVDEKGRNNTVYILVTDSEGKATHEINESAGKYMLEFEFGGSDGYAESNIEYSLEVKEKEEPKETQTSNSNSGYADYEKTEFTGEYDSEGKPIYYTVTSTSKYGGQLMYPGVYEEYWSENGPIYGGKIR